jgi:hypothetical protein
MAKPGNEHLAHFDPISFGTRRDGYSFTGAYVETLIGQTSSARNPFISLKAAAGATASFGVTTLD